MLRLLIAALLVANLVFFSWARGWFAPAWPPPRQGEREPERLAAQLRPEAVKVLPPQAASAALSAARAAAARCLEAGPLAAADLAAAEAALAPVQLPDGALAREPLTPPLWLLYLPRGADAATRRAREQELRKAGLAFDVWPAASAPAELAGALTLSRHATRVDAEAAQAALAASTPALRNLHVAELPAPPQRLWLRVASADPDQQARLRALPASAAAALGGGFKPCAPRP